MKTELLNQLKKETKFSLHYILKAVNHERYFYTYEESFSKPKLIELVFNELTENNFEKCKQLNPYKKYTMKTLKQLKKEKEQKTTDLIKKVSMFFAFSDSQFNENKTQLKKGDIYLSIGAGMFLPKSEKQNYREGIKNISEWYEKEIIDNNLRDKNILYALCNHECFYTGDYQEAFYSLGHGYTIEEIIKVYNENLHLQD